jgi:predicted negative regulator of RcsB-dependent stress response
MYNELIIKETWWKNNRKWFLTALILFSILLIGLISNSIIDGNVTDIAQAYSDNLLYKKSS